MREPQMTCVARRRSRHHATTNPSGTKGSPFMATAPPSTHALLPPPALPRFASCNCSALVCTHCFENQLLKSSTKMDFTPVSSFNKMFRCPAENNKNKSSTHCQHVQESFLFYDLLLYFLVYQIWLGNSLSVLLSPSLLKSHVTRPKAGERSQCCEQ